MRLAGQRHAPAALPPGKTRYRLYRRLGGPHSRSGRVRKTSSPSGFDSRTVQPLASRYTVWAIPTHERQNKSSHYSISIKFNLIKTYRIVLANNIEFYKGWIRRLSLFQYLNCHSLLRCAVPIIRHVTLFWNADSSRQRQLSEHLQLVTEVSLYKRMTD